MNLQIIKADTKTPFFVIADASDTIADLKASITEAEGMPAAKQRILFQGKYIDEDDNVVLGDIPRLKDGSMLFLSVKKGFSL